MTLLKIGFPRKIRKVKPRSKRRSWPTIRLRRNPGGTRSWMVDPGMVNGTRPRKFFTTKSDAETHAEQLRIARKNEGHAAFNLSQELRLQALEAEKKLRAAGATLPQAVTFYLQHAAPRGGNKLLTDVISELISSKEKSGKKESYVSTLQWVLNAFARNFDGREIGTIGREEIESWLDDFKNLATRRNRIRDVSILFRFALKRGYCGSNPITEIERPTVTPTRPEIYSIEEVKSLLATAFKYPNLGMLPVLVIGFFAGLRISELLKLRWENISLEHGVIDVSEKIAKTRQQRNVEITKTLSAWLKLCCRKSGPVAPDPKDYRFHRQALVGFADGVSKWKDNGLRHSFGSYHLARFKNAGNTALQMGHNTTDMLFKHYWNYQIRPADAKLYWQLRPRSVAR